MPCTWLICARLAEKNHLNCQSVATNHALSPPHFYLSLQHVKKSQSTRHPITPLPLVPIIFHGRSPSGQSVIAIMLCPHLTPTNFTGCFFAYQWSNSNFREYPLHARFWAHARPSIRQTLRVQWLFIGLCVPIGIDWQCIT
jgi:hypothetical protein